MELERSFFCMKTTKDGKIPFYNTCKGGFRETKLSSTLKKKVKGGGIMEGASESFALISSRGRIEKKNN